MGNSTASFGWNLISVLDTEPTHVDSSLLFNSTLNPGLYDHHNQPYAYVPRLLMPTVSFHQAIARLLRRKYGIAANYHSFPYAVDIPSAGTNCSMSFTIRLFAPTILSLSVRLSGFHTDIEASKLIKLQRLDKLSPVNVILRAAIGLVKTGDHRHIELEHPFYYKPIIRLNEFCSKDDLQDHLSNNAALYTGILIRNLAYDRMAAAIPDGILLKNAQHNMKSSSEALLIDKQGMLYLTADEHSKHPDDVYLRATAWYELGLVASVFLDNYFAIRQRYEHLADFILSRLRPWLHQPEAVMSKSVTSFLIWQLILSEFKLVEKERLVATEAILRALEEKSGFFSQFRYDWWGEANLGQLMEEEFTELDIPGFAVIADSKMRQLVMRDYAEAKRCFHGRNYKATILLSGSVLEAVLTAVLADRGLVSVNELYKKYVLVNLIDAAQQHKLLHDKSLYSLLDPVRNYRNLIHPGVEMRGDLVPDKPKAQIALETINLVLSDLSRSQP